MPKQSPEHPWNVRAREGYLRAQKGRVRRAASSTGEGLAEMLPRVIAEAKRDLLPRYSSKPELRLILAALRADLSDAETALQRSDVAGMLRAYNRLVGYT